MEKHRNNFFIDSLLAVNNSAIGSDSKSSKEIFRTCKDISLQSLQANSNINLEANYDAFCKYYKFYKTDINERKEVADYQNKLVFNLTCFTLYILRYLKFNLLELLF